MSIEIMFDSKDGALERVHHHARHEPVKADGYPVGDEAFVAFTVGKTTLFLSPEQARTAGDALYAAAERAAPSHADLFEVPA